MRGIAFWFFFSAAVYLLLGMLFGIYMASTDDHAWSSAHAHLNLIGWVTMGMFGLYHHNVPAAAQTALAKLHFAVATVGVWILIPGIVLALERVTEVLAIVGSLTTLLSILMFIVIMLRARMAEA